MASNLTKGRYDFWRYDMDAHGHRLHNLGNPVGAQEPVRMHDVEVDAWVVGGLWSFQTGIKTNTVDEYTSGSGVTIDGVLIKDGYVDGGDVSDLNTKMTLLYTTIGLSALTSAEVDQLENIGSATISSTQWLRLGAMDQGVATGNSPTFAGMTLNGDLDMNQNNIVDVGTIGAFQAGGDINFSDTYSILNVATVLMKAGGWIGDADGWLTFDQANDKLILGGMDLDLGSNSMTGTNVTLTGDLTQATTKWWGLGAAKGRLVLTDAATDLITVTTANLRLDGTNVVELNAATEGFYSGAAGYVDIKAATAIRHAAYATFGSTATSHSLSANGDVMVSGKLEVDGSGFFDGSALVLGTGDLSDVAFYLLCNTASRNMILGREENSTRAAIIFDYARDQLLHTLSSLVGNQLVLTLHANEAKNHDHAAQTNPTLFVHSGTNPDAANDEWWSITHDVTDAIYNVGSGLHKFTGGAVQTTSGRIVNTTRITGATTLNGTHHNVFCDTDGGAFTVTLPAGVNGTKYRIINTGSAGNDVTVTPDGAELLLGANASLTVMDGDVLVIVYETTEGWY